MATTEALCPDAAAAIIQPMLLTHGLHIGDSSEGSKCSEATYILKVVSTEVANELDGRSRKRKAGGMSPGLLS